MVVNRVFIHRTGSGRSAAWLARLPWEQEVGGSNPLAPTIRSRSGRTREETPRTGYAPVAQ